MYVHNIQNTNANPTSKHTFQMVFSYGRHVTRSVQTMKLPANKSGYIARSQMCNRSGRIPEYTCMWQFNMFAAMLNTSHLKTKILQWSKDGTLVNGVSPLTVMKSLKS